MRPLRAIPAGRRGSAAAWLDAAYQCFIDSGVEAVRIMPIARRLRLSRTSFYWFFRDRDSLLAALLAQWEAKNTGNLVRQAGAYAETIGEAMLNVFDCWLNRELFDPELEFAMRSWAQQSAPVAERVRAADAARLGALKAMFLRFGFGPLLADVRARTTYLAQIGYISMQTKEDLATRMKRIPSYVEIFTGRRPDRRELDRFVGRHGHPPRMGTRRRKPSVVAR